MKRAYAVRAGRLTTASSMAAIATLCRQAGSTDLRPLRGRRVGNAVIRHFAEHSGKARNLKRNNRLSSPARGRKTALSPYIAGVELPPQPPPPATTNRPSGPKTFRARQNLLLAFAVAASPAAQPKLQRHDRPLDRETRQLCRSVERSPQQGQEPTLFPTAATTQRSPTRSTHRTRTPSPGPHHVFACMPLNIGR